MNPEIIQPADIAQADARRNAEAEDRMVRVICSRAHDAADAALLLDAFGLLNRSQSDEPSAVERAGGQAGPTPAETPSARVQGWGQIGVRL